MAFELDARGLRYFAAVARYRSYTIAAAHLRITQPAITRQVQAIEREFGVRLFKRQGREMALTESGQVLLDQATDILDRIDNAGALVKHAADEPSGRIALGAPMAMGELLLPRILARFRVKYPRVFLHVITGYTGDLAQMLAEGKLDLAMIFGAPGSHADLDVQPLMDLDLGLVAPPAGVLRPDTLANRKRITLAEAAALPLIFPSKAQTLRAVVEQACRQASITPNIVMESDSLGMSKALVKVGAGCMFLAGIGVRQEVEAGELRYLRLSPAGPSWQLSLATRRSKSVGLATRVLMREIVETCHRSEPDTSETRTRSKTT